MKKKFLLFGVACMAQSLAASGGSDGWIASATSALQAAAAGGASWWHLIPLAFIAGIFTSFLPCIYPMIPITVGILQANQSRRVGYNFLLSLAYVLGIALVYASLGYAVATSSMLFGSWLANRWVVGGMTLFFLYLACSMLGFYELHIPRFLQQRELSGSHGSALRCLVLGMVSATVASPCLTPPLAIILGLVSKQASPVLGFVVLLSFSLGMGMLLLVIGSFSGALVLLPRAGEWLDEIKRLMGFVMLGVCVNFVAPFLDGRVPLLLYDGICSVAAVWYGYAAWQQWHGGSRGWAVVYGVIAVGALLGAGYCGLGAVGAYVSFETPFGLLRTSAS